MNIRLMPIRVDLTLAAALEALKMVNELEVGAIKGGVDFVELQFAPDVEQLDAAEKVAEHLLHAGVGCKVRIHWPFKGTKAWALQTEHTRVVNEGMWMQEA